MPRRSSQRAWSHPTCVVASGQHDHTAMSARRSWMLWLNCRLRKKSPTNGVHDAYYRDTPALCYTYHTIPMLPNKSYPIHVPRRDVPPTLSPTLSVVRCIKHQSSQKSPITALASYQHPTGYLHRLLSLSEIWNKQLNFFTLSPLSYFSLLLSSSPLLSPTPHQPIFPTYLFITNDFINQNTKKNFHLQPIAF